MGVAGALTSSPAFTVTDSTALPPLESKLTVTSLPAQEANAKTVTTTHRTRSVILKKLFLIAFPLKISKFIINTLLYTI